MSWREQAACWNVWPAIDFFDPDQDYQARQLCRTCPVQTECGEYAATATGPSIRDGVWAGRRRYPETTSDHCRHGHERNAVNTYRAPDGRLICKPCRRRNDRQWRGKQTA